MDRRQFLRSAAATAALGAPLAAAAARTITNRTRWIVRESEGFDALSFLSPLSGDSFYLPYYEREVAAFAPRMPAGAMETLRALMTRARGANILLSPFLDLRFSAGPDATINDLIRSLDAAETVLRPPFEASPYWGANGAEGWAQFMASAPQIRSVLVALRDAGFPAFRAEIVAPKAAVRIPAAQARLATVDIIAEVERLTGRAFGPRVEVVLLEFAKPHGIKVIGQKFLTGIDYDDNITIRTAAHELLHPPVDMNGPAARTAMGILERNETLRRVIAERNPAFGYGSVQGLFDEDLVEALDQIITDRLGVAPEPATERWKRHDGGIHILAPAFYTLLRRSGFAERGGNLETWLRNAARSGWLEPGSLAAAAAPLLDRPPDRLWPPPQSQLAAPSGP